MAEISESVGRKTYIVSDPHPSSGHPLPQAGEGGFYFQASIIEHKLPIVGKFFYVPRGPIVENQKSKIKNQNENSKLKNFLSELTKLTIDNNAGWIRIEPATSEILEKIKNNIEYEVVKAPHDMQPKEILVMDITKPEEQLLSEMKSKTRYNIKLAEKHGVKISRLDSSSRQRRAGSAGMTKCVDEFIRLTKIMSKRQRIQAHPDGYYWKMLETIPSDILKLYIAEYKDKIIAANLVVFYGNTCTYLHGASDDNYRSVMAPHLLQWKQIQNAKAAGFEKYDFGGVKIKDKIGKSWEGITRFKTGFSPDAKLIEFPGSYDIIVSPFKYWIYRIIQKIKNII